MFVYCNILLIILLFSLQSTWFNKPIPTIYYACKAGNKEFVLYLLSKGSSCNDIYHVSKLFETLLYSVSLTCTMKICNLLCI